ncbi:MAG: hypothetical protein K2X47_07200, partial [Bdellovibrionales bacterium]|nr:hypothetical protein [Bdellovibrionales bacterium]
MVLRHLFLALLFISSTPVFAANQIRCSVIATRGELQEGKNVNQLVRRNPRDFFGSDLVKAWLKTSPYAKYIGLILGDNHTNNMGLDFINGYRDFTVLDLDDVGFGPVLLGLTKTMILAKSATTEIKYKDMVDAFFKGLSGSQQMSIPKEIREQLDISEEEFLDELEEYAERKSQGNQIEELEEYSKMTDTETKVIKDAVEKFLPRPAKFLSGMRMEKETGGSADARRYRVLARVQGRKLILDIKEVMAGNLFKGIGSQDPETHMSSVLDLVFRGDTEGRRVRKLKVDGDKKKARTFLLRAKVEVDP